MADPREHLVVIHDAPEEMLSRELAVWLHEMGLWPNRLFVNADQRHEDMQHNYAIEQALKRPYDLFCFIESDMRPIVEATAVFWAAEADVVACDYATEIAEPHKDRTPMHCGFYRTHRAVLEAIRDKDPPCFEWPSNPQRTHVTGCLCHTFCRKVLAMGFTIAKAGSVEHWPRAKRSAH